MNENEPTGADSSQPHKRRVRYGGTHPRRFEERYKEHASDLYQEHSDHIRARGRTPAGTHVPIMLAEVMDALQPKPGDIVADCTLGYGGHAEAFMTAISESGRLLGLDWDGQQLERTGQRLSNLGANLSLHRSNYAGLAKVLATEGIAGCDVVFADLGVSSMQLDNPARGFSYKQDGPLDMRMDSRRPQSAADILASISQEDLASALRDYADEEDADIIATAIVEHRNSRPIQRTQELADVVMAAKGVTRKQWRQEKSADTSLRHPAAKTFQAIRILVNDELGSLRQLLRDAPWCLRSGGRLGILTFHSGEDRLVKKAFRAGYGEGLYSVIADTVIRPTPKEIAENPRSRPAKFRWAIKGKE